MPGTYDVVRDAILRRQRLIATYAGHRREMCPHAIGQKGGQQQALFFQFGGTSASGLPPGGEWRCIPIEGLSDVEVAIGEWRTDGRHSQRQTCIDEVDVEVEHT